MYPLTFDHLKLAGKTSAFSNYVFAPSMEQKLQYIRQKNWLQLHPRFFSLYILVFLPLDPHWFQWGSGSGPRFYLNADLDPDPDPGSQTNVDPDPDPGQTLKS